jgi:hypothetical protein
MCFRYCPTLENHDTLQESSRLAGGHSNFQGGCFRCQAVVAKSSGLSAPLKMHHDAKLPFPIIRFPAGLMKLEN